MEAAHLIGLRLVAEQSESHALVERLDVTLDRLDFRVYSEPQMWTRFGFPPEVTEIVSVPPLETADDMPESG